jgi:phage terminase small subunit
MALSIKQERFVSEFLIDGNGTAAVIRAGYSVNGAKQVASKLLKHPQVAEAVAEGQAAITKRNQVDQDWVIQNLKRIAQANMMDYMRVQPDGNALGDLSKLTRDQAYAISEIVCEEYVDGTGKAARRVKSTKFKLKDTIRANELLGKNLGMFKDKVEVEHAGGITVVLTGSDVDL